VSGRPSSCSVRKAHLATQSRVRSAVSPTGTSGARRESTRGEVEHAPIDVVPPPLVLEDQGADCFNLFVRCGVGRALHPRRGAARVRRIPQPKARVHDGRSRLRVASANSDEARIALRVTSARSQRERRTPQLALDECR
jgi:hypothetical protein